MTDTATPIAIDYANLGLCVLPVEPETKKPMLRSWEKYTRQRPDTETLKQWFDYLNPVGWGAVTGSISGIVVVDVDTRSGMDYREITKKYPTEWIARTPSGGYHLYYRHPGHEVRNRVNIVPGVDIRGDGGFIVLPPTGGRYSWVKRGVLGDYPAGFIREDETGGDRETERWVSDLMKGVESGSRNESATRLAGYFLNKSMPVDIVFSILREWNEKNDPPMGLKELETTIQSVYRRHRKSGSDNSNGQKFDLMTMVDYFREYGGEGVQWTVRDWLPKDSVVFLVSPPESYKTWMLFDLAVSLATGCDFLGEYTVDQRGPVIIVQQEDSHAGITERLSVIIQSKMGLHPVMGNEVVAPRLPDLPIYIHPSRRLRFDDKIVMDELEEMIQRIKPVCVIIDPLYSAASTEGYMASATEDMFRLKQFRDQYGCSFVISHHSKKHVDPDSTQREDGWGSQFLNAFLEAGWQIRRNSRLADNEVIVRRHSKTMGNYGTILVRFDISTNYPMRYAVHTEPYETTGDRSPAENQLYQLIMEEPGTVLELAERIGKHKSTVSRQLKSLETRNQIVKMPDGKFKIWGGTEDEL